MITIHLPVKSLKDPFFNHSGDTFRELAVLWAKAGFVKIVDTNSYYVWIGDSPETDQSIILYDRPTLEWWNRHPPKHYSCALFGNYIPTQQEVPRSYPWIFWGRKPELMTDIQPQNWDHRIIDSIFLGKIENSVQQQYRNAEIWKSCVQKFILVHGKATPYPYSHTEYLRMLSYSKYGLSLRGYGPKCNREIELMACGTVPIVTPDVDMSGYFSPPQIGIHYFVARDPDEFTNIIRNTTKQEWREMSNACVDWYKQNASVDGSFYQTMRLINTLKTSALIGAPTLSSWSVPERKLSGYRRLVIDTVFFERPFSGITRVWIGLLKHLKGICVDKKFDIVLLVRRQALVNLPVRLLQSFSFVNIQSFNYNTETVEYLDNVCKQLEADLFISTYYTYTKYCDCIAYIHDMIPELYGAVKDAMWRQKDECIANAKWFACVSESSMSYLKHYHPSISDSRMFVVPNCFDPFIFESCNVDRQIATGDATHRLKAELNITQPFVFVLTGNGDPYKNTRLVTDMISMNNAYFRSNVMVVVLTTAAVDSNHMFVGGINGRLLKKVSDEQLGFLYGLASALIYPSRCEGFGLPVLEAFWSECPVICCKKSGLEEVGGDGCFYVDPNNPVQLFNTVKAIVGRTNESEVREKAKFGLTRLDKYTVKTQTDAFMNMLSKTFKDVIIKIETPKEEMSNPITTQTKLHLMINYYVDKDVDRRAELDFCVQANLANAHVEQLHCFVSSDVQIPDWLKQNPKCVLINLKDQRLSYKEAFDYANANLIGQTVALMNLDIFLDHDCDWPNAKDLFDMSIVLCLSRHEFDGIGESKKDPTLQSFAYANSQDCWVFRAPIWVKECDFKMGMLGCDSAIAHRLKASGYIPVNSPNEFKIHHYDLCRGKTGSNYMKLSPANPERPEEKGYYFLPDYSALSRVMIKKKTIDPQTKVEKETETPVMSVDDLIEKMGLGQMHRYRIICDIMSNYIKLNNK